MRFLLALFIIFALATAAKAAVVISETQSLGTWVVAGFVILLPAVMINKLTRSGRSG